ncbi:hypothetical protein SAMN05216404_1293 [Nitrosospira multiformis]|uniref:Uncharacterized protein n=2 Tax=Nitrosospira multiformis TaxID=1231 RepID=A0A1H8Q827_9PROT|nr:hypothetical protein SAMN05216404_1293 [Nitrosospira multiformis]
MGISDGKTEVNSAPVLFSRLVRLQNYFFESHVLDATSWGISIYLDSGKDTSSLLCSADASVLSREWEELPSVLF